MNEMSVYSVRSAIACAILVHDKQENILNIAFRGFTFFFFPFLSSYNII